MDPNTFVTLTPGYFFSKYTQFFPRLEGRYLPKITLIGETLFEIFCLQTHRDQDKQMQSKKLHSAKLGQGLINALYQGTGPLLQFGPLME